MRTLQCRHLFVSYNSEGIIPDDEIYTILKTRGKVEMCETEYPIFGRGAGVAKNARLRNGCSISVSAGKAVAGQFFSESFSCFFWKNGLQEIKS